MGVEDGRARAAWVAGLPTLYLPILARLRSVLSARRSTGLRSADSAGAGGSELGVAPMAATSEDRSIIQEVYTFGFYGRARRTGRASLGRGSLTPRAALRRRHAGLIGACLAPQHLTSLGLLILV